MEKIIQVAAPTLIGNEKAYVLDCLDSNWISSNGKYIELFETQFADFCQARYALSCSNGTVALHLALLALGIGQGDEVLVPTLTYVATANAVMYCGATPVFVDSEYNTWNIDPNLIESKINTNTKAIIVVHLYGCPVELTPILEIAQKYNLWVIEDAAEAHGAEYKEQKVGVIGDIGTFSFYGNKIITTGEGGMVVTNNEQFAQKMRQLKGQGMDLNRRYWFPIIGYNYRMTNIAAAIGLGQLEKIDWHIERRRQIAHQYKSRLFGIPGICFQDERSWVKAVYWMSSIVLSKDAAISRDRLMEKLFEMGIETRPFFFPMHTLPIYKNQINSQNYPIADLLSATGINLPSSANLSSQDIDYICDRIISLISY